MELPPPPPSLSSHHSSADSNSLSRFNPHQGQQLHPLQQQQQQQQRLQPQPYAPRKQRRPLSYQQHQHPPPPPAASSSSSSHHPYDANKHLLRTPSPHHRQSPSLGRFTEEWDASQRGSSILDGRRGPGSGSATGSAAMQRANSVNSYAVGDDQQQLPARGNNTLKKKSSMRRAASLGRSSSRRSTRAGSVRSLALHSAADPDDQHSAFFCPVPTDAAPTDVLVNRFQAWRKVLKDLIAYYREIQSHYEQRSKSLTKLANVANNVSTPPSFLRSAGIDDAIQFLRNYNKAAILEANKAKEIEEDVILALTGLRSDLQQKIKEIKHLSGDFKNSVDKEMDATARAVHALADVLEKSEVDASSTTGKQDPYLLRLAVDRQIERQLDEENYLHQAHLNLEGSGRELESIIVGEIQKAYNAYAGILKREADNAHGVIDELRDGPLSMPKDQEWIHFVTQDDRVIDPAVPLRSSDQIHYPGQDHLSAQEIRAGLLERKSKYLKSYTAGWYVLSTTHLHEFKSADKTQAPVMSLYLPEQKLGSHSSEGGSSNKFVLKGRQTGAMHRGHSWVFRAESHDTMMAWYEDIKALTEKSPEERSEFVRTHSRRSMSQSSRRSGSSDGLDEEDEEPFTATEQDVNPAPQPDLVSRRSQPGGRFPSDIQVNAQRGLQVPHSPSSVSSTQEHPSDARAIAAASALPGAAIAAYATGRQRQEGEMEGEMEGQGEGEGEQHAGYGSNGQVPMEDIPSQAAIANHEAQFDGVNPYTSEPLQKTQDSHNQGGGGSGGDGGQIAIPQGHNSNNNNNNNNKETNAYAVDGERPASQNGIDEVDGEHYTNARAVDGGDHVNNNNNNMVMVNSDAIPRSEAQKDIEGLQVVVPKQDAAGHDTEIEPPVTASNDNDYNTTTTTNTKPARPDSTATVSNLPMPGSFPMTSISSP